MAKRRLAGGLAIGCGRHLHRFDAILIFQARLRRRNPPAASVIIRG
jgi:hypothetical protein